MLTFQAHRFNSSNSIEANNLVDRGAADRAPPLLGLDILQAGHATSHVAARNAGTFHRGIKTDNTGARGSAATAARISLIFSWSSRCCCCATFGGSRHDYIDRSGIYGWILNRAAVEGFFREWWGGWGWKRRKCFLRNHDWRVDLGFVGSR